MGRRENGVGVY